MDLDLILEDGLAFTVALFTTASTRPGEVTISLDTHGPSGGVSGGTFDQLGDALPVGGDITVAGLLDNVTDLSTQKQDQVDFIDDQILLDGDIVVIAATFAFEELNAQVPFTAAGTIVARGEVTAIAKSSKAVLLLVMCALLPTRRIR